MFGFDISPELINQATKEWSEYADSINFQVGDAESLDLEDNSVDICFYGGVLHHFPNKQKVYSECFRILKTSGKFIAIEPNLLDVLERIEWKIAGLRGKLSPNEFPIDPIAMQQELLDAGFCNSMFTTTRSDIPFLAQIPIIKRWFSRQRGFAIKQPLIQLINTFRPPAHRGTFFVIQAIKG